jgi:hypothetical protein
LGRGLSAVVDSERMVLCEEEVVTIIKNQIPLQLEKLSQRGADQCLFSQGLVHCMRICAQRRQRIWGEDSLGGIQEILHARQEHKANPRQKIVQQQWNIKNWFEAPQLAQVIVSNSLRSAYDDIQIIKDSESKLSDRMIEYLGGRKFPNEYHASELREKYILDDWIACNLIFGRPIRIFLYGNEKHFSAGLKISHASSRERLQDYKP